MTVVFGRSINICIIMEDSGQCTLEEVAILQDGVHLHKALSSGPWSCAAGFLNLSTTNILS